MGIVKNIASLTCMCGLIWNVLTVNVNASVIVDKKTIPEPQIRANNAIVMNVQTGEIIYEKNSESKVQMASTTKLMTALLLAENKTPEDRILFTESAKKQPSSSIYKDIGREMRVGDSLSAKDVMNGLLLESGNDMAVMIAESISGDELSFSNKMDERAKEIGMVNTDFYTSNGLDTNDVLDGNEHYSTAYDMALLGIEAYKNEMVKNSMGTKKANMTTDKGYSFIVENTNNNLGINGCVAGKTGYTTKAGRCLVAIYDRGGETCVGVVLGSTQDEFFEDMDKIMDYAYKSERKVVKDKNGEKEIVQMKFKPLIVVGKEVNQNIPVYLDNDVLIYDNKYNKENTTFQIVVEDISVWELKKDAVVAKLVVNEKNKSTSYNLYSTLSIVDIISENRGIYIKSIGIGVILIIVTCLCGFCIRKRYRL